MLKHIRKDGSVGSGASLMTWQQSLSQAVRHTAELLEALEIPNTHDESVVLAQKDFPCLVPHEFIARMEKGNPRDPLLLQVLPQAMEMQQVPGFSVDPVAESKYNPVPGLLHKYPSRVLLTLAGGCAVNCRYCFRRHFPYQDNMPGQQYWADIIQYIQSHPEIDEVIFSGGDPLLLKDHLLAGYVSQIEQIEHVVRVRIHTRLPIVIPQRVTQAWIDWINQTKLQVVVVFHVNHPNEIDADVKSAMARLRSTKAVLLSQAVLLKDVNDDVGVLAQLSHRLFDAGVLPYYLHLLDKVQGAAHYDTSAERAAEIMSALKTRLPGFLVPKLAQEVPGRLSKQY